MLPASLMLPVPNFDGGVKAAELGIKPLARIVATASASVDPSIMGIGVVLRTTVLKIAGREKRDMKYGKI
jgi:acetyl-CoA C-acetyltransferase